MRVGFLVSPAVVGAIADAAGLRVGLLGVVVAGLVIVALGAGAEPGQCTAPTNSIVSTPAMISPIPSTIIGVSGSANSNLAQTATSATPHADHTP